MKTIVLFLLLTVVFAEDEDPTHPLGRHLHCNPGDVKECAVVEGGGFQRCDDTGIWEAICTASICHEGYEISSDKTSCVMCKPGFFKDIVSGDECTACTNKPKNAKYTNYGWRHSICPYDCLTGYGDACITTRGTLLMFGILAAAIALFYRYRLRPALKHRPARQSILAESHNLKV